MFPELHGMAGPFPRDTLIARARSPKTEAGARQIPLSENSVAPARGMEGPTQEHGAGGAGVLDAAGHAHFAEQRAASVDLPGLQALGLPHATWLTFRRTYSSWSHDKGVPGKVVAQLMGHANVDTTLNVYTQVLDGSCGTPSRKSAANCSQLFTGPRGPVRS